MLYEVADKILKCKQLGTTLNQCNAVYRETCLQGSHLKEFVQHNTCVGITLYIHNDTHTFAVALVVYVADSFQLLVGYQLRNVFDQLLLVYAIGNLCDDNLIVQITAFYIGLGAHNHTSPTRFVCILDALESHDVSTCREVRTFNILHQRFYIHILVVDISNASVNYFAEVMGRNVSCHTDSNTCCTVHQQVWYLSGHNCGFGQGVVEVHGHINRLLVQVVHHSFTHQA